MNKLYLAIFTLVIFAFFFFFKEKDRTHVWMMEGTFKDNPRAHLAVYGYGKTVEEAKKEANITIEKYVGGRDSCRISVQREVPEMKKIKPKVVQWGSWDREIDLEWILAK